MGPCKTPSSDGPADVQSDADPTVGVGSLIEVFRVFPEARFLDPSRKLGSTYLDRLLGFAGP
jgi:hypothetical protein